jgi:hypothetical protein
VSIWDYVVNAVNWLLAYSSTAISWIKYHAGQVANAIVNSTVGHVYNVVQGWLNNQYWSLRNWATGFINSIKAVAYSAWNWVQSAYWTVSNWIEAKIKPIWDAVADWIGNLYNSIVEWSVKTYNQVVAWASPIIDWVKQQVANIQEWIAGVWEFIQSQINLFSSKTKERFTALFDDGWDNFSSFLFNPLSFILAMIIPIFMDIFCYAAAYGLGTVKHSLPPWPSWDQLTQFGDGERPAIVPSGLVPPLAKMYVSGYRFGGSHRATDYGCTSNCPVFACHGGVVEFAGWSSVGYGNCVTIRGGHWWSRYAHLLNFNVAVGQEIPAGHIVGGCDTTGNSTGNHLHLELKYKGSFINPETVF